MLIVSFTEEERQLLLLSLASLSLDRPGFEYFAREISMKLQGEWTFDSFRESNAASRRPLPCDES